VPHCAQSSQSESRDGTGRDPTKTIDGPRPAYCSYASFACPLPCGVEKVSPQTASDPTRESRGHTQTSNMDVRVT